MDIQEILTELRRYQPLKESHAQARKVSRFLLDKYFSEIPYTNEKKEWELKFFYKNIEFITKKWILEIIWELETYKGSIFNELKRAIKGISSRSLSICL